MSAVPPQGPGDRSLDALLDDFIVAWHSGEAPSAEWFVARADPAFREEVAQLLSAFLEIAPSVEPKAARQAELNANPLVARLAALEGAYWAALEAPSEAPAVAADPASDAFGARLAALRTAAGM